MIIDNLIDKIKGLITPVIPASEDTIKELQAKTQELEQQADFAETEAKLIDRSNKAKKRIRTAKRGGNKQLLYILAGLVFIIILIVILAGNC